MMEHEAGPNALNVGHLVRLKAAIDGTAQTATGAAGGHALVSAANTFRRQILQALTDELRVEFEATFPRPIDQSSRGPLGEDVIRLAQMADEGRVRLAGMSGWLDGLVKSHKD